MAASKKIVIQKENPIGKKALHTQNPESYYTKHPCWNFHTCDTEKWAFTKNHIGDLIWTEILPRLQAWEASTWQEILVLDKKNNHSIEAAALNSEAHKRLSEKFIEKDAIISLRLTGTHRIYGYMQGAVFNILWYDDDHGDNDRCVCRSRLKHT